eukprot:CAMPEP_0202451438 /NCGR_PEP_ID=MMETSP1360-20130828/9880_1 /ASSEMBLY_ACC=CAM_ASM_000848 /TAXON_ID=515479 /ORGANISM="Licmophora paradoxa, Strain CCMP2313" /LENGTH=70 /DNA_ID=CAMNT_0049070015 /DNA_START=14 /DNA_END=226 /DNA_ORIENTATION=-
MTSGVAFATNGAHTGAAGTTLTTNGRDLSHITCYNCQEQGYYSNQCPHPQWEQTADASTNNTVSGTQLTM